MGKCTSGNNQSTNTLMMKNMGITDKTIRILIAAAIGILYITNIISGTLALILGILAFVLVLTSFIGFCPLYLPFGMNTCKKDKS